jgi:hypothetical protein
MSRSESPSVLEFGSHVGINLRMLSDALDVRNLRMYAVEPNAEAFRFMQEKLPNLGGLLGDDAAYVNTVGFPGGQVDVSFANSVFYCIEAERAKPVIEKMCATSEVVVIGDSMDNLGGERSQVNLEPFYFKHPYELWLRDFGFVVSRVELLANAQPQLNGYVVAHRSRDL